MFNSISKKVFILLLIPLLSLALVSCDFSDEDSSDDEGAKDSYFVKMKINGVETTYDSGYTKMDDKPAISYNSTDDESALYAFFAEVSFSDMGSATGLMVTGIPGKEAGTFTTCTIVYYDEGTMNAAPNCSVTIDTYGADGEAVTGSIANFTAGGKVFTDCTFNVYNYGNE